MSAIPLGSGGEFDRIRAIVDALGDVMGDVGDDTAVVPRGRGTLVVSVDASVEDVHFRRSWLTLEEIGWRATASALSDLAAAAVAPVGVIAAVVVPRRAGEAALVELMSGVGAAVRSVGARILGGDLTSGTQWSVVVTVLGRATKPMSRVGARPGDGLWVTGVLGGARAALQAWTIGVDPDPEARHAFAHPVPRIGAARWLADHGATAMLDLSDGLGGDAEHLAIASGVQLRIELERLPLHASVRVAAQHVGESPERFAAGAGEDYELLVTLPGEFAASDEFHRTTGVPLVRIGGVMAGEGVEATLRGVPLTVHGYRHAI